MPRPKRRSADATGNRGAPLSYSSSPNAFNVSPDGQSAAIILEARFDALLIEELLQALFASVIGIAQLGLIEFCVEVVLTLLPGEFSTALETMLGRAEHDGVLCGEFACQDQRFFTQVFKGYCAINQAHLRGLFACEGLARHDVLKSLAMSDGIRKGLAYEVAGWYSRINLRESEDSRFGCNG